MYKGFSFSTASLVLLVITINIPLYVYTTFCLFIHLSVKTCVTPMGGFFFLLAVPCDMWDLSSLTRGRTRAPCSGSAKPS